MMQIITRERYEHIKRDPKRSAKVREDYVPMQVWSPIISEKERAERQQKIEAGILPF
jgi:hypothetical protein